MLRAGTALFACLLPWAAQAQTPVSLHASYETYAAGINVAEVDANFRFNSWNYQMNLAYHTTGLAGFFYSGHQLDAVSGSWRNNRAIPFSFLGEGLWRGRERIAAIDFDRGQPIVRQLAPPNDGEREEVPPQLRQNTIDTLSALAELIRTVDTTGRCETMVHTFDGRRALVVEAHTGGEEILQPTDRSTFAGRALRCDFAGRMLAGFRLEDERSGEAKPMHGSAWLASVTDGGPRVPVRMAFETRWFGDATMYLTGVGPAGNLSIARRN